MTDVRSRDAPIGLMLEPRFWGTRGSRPAPATADCDTRMCGGNTSCAEVRLPDGATIILDSGTGIAALGDAMVARGAGDVLLLITHAHWDHIQGFPFFAPADIAGFGLAIRGPAPAGGSSLRATLSTQMSPTYFPASMESLRATITVADLIPDEPFVWHGVTVTPHALPHTTPTLGYRLDAGSSLVYATDCELRPLFEGRAADTAARLERLIRWAGDSDILIHDAQYTEAEYAARQGWGHSTAGDAVGFAQRSGASRLVLWHHDPAHSDDAIAAITERAADEATGGLEVLAAHEGETVSITGGGDSPRTLGGSRPGRSCDIGPVRADP